MTPSLLIFVNLKRTHFHGFPFISHSPKRCTVLCCLDIVPLPNYL